MSIPNENIKTVSILLAMYRPNTQWLIEQLQSLNQQDYLQIELIIWDDCPEYPVDEGIIEEHITRFPYQLIRGERNLGSSLAFENLTTLARGDYIAYCDQDDIWLPNKISTMVRVIEKREAALVCCDQYIIDEHGNRIADTIQAIRKRHVFHGGKGVAKYLVSDNFVTGCACLLPTWVAKKAIPFETIFVHDQWIALVAALEGSIEVIEEPLIEYRQHSNNQTGILTGVHDKASYYEWRIEYFLKRAKALQRRLGNVEEIKQEIQRYERWMQARKAYFRHPNWGSLHKMIQGKSYGRQTVLLEALLPTIPKKIFGWILTLAKKGVL